MIIQHSEVPVCSGPIPMPENPVIQSVQPETKWGYAKSIFYVNISHHLTLPWYLFHFMLVMTYHHVTLLLTLKLLFNLLTCLCKKNLTS